MFRGSHLNGAGDDLSTSRIAICDDSITNVMVLAKLLENEGCAGVQTFTDPRKLIPYVRASAGSLDLLILDIEMPHLNGFEVMAELKAALPPEQQLFPVLVITGALDKDTRYRALQVGATDFLNKPIDPTEVLLRTRNMLRMRGALKTQQAQAARLELEVEKRTRELDCANDMLVHLLGLAGELRDNETGNHVRRVGKLSRLIAEKIGLPAELCYMIEKAAPMHDLGKIGIPDRILHKPESLDEGEWQVMRTHTELGLRLLGEFGHDSMMIRLAASIAYNHHEWWDGSGYPRGLRGESIPVEGRIVAVADVFDALIAQRPYKAAWPLDRAVEQLRQRAGNQLDPSLVETFLGALDEATQIAETLRDPEDGITPLARYNHVVLPAATLPQRRQ